MKNIFNFLLNRMKCIHYGFLILGLGLNVSFADNGCTTRGSANAFLGSIPSFSFLNYSESIYISDAGLTCKFGLIKIISFTDWIEGTVSGDTFLTNESNPEDKIAFRLYMDESENLITYGKPQKYSGNAILDVLGIFGSTAAANMPLYVSIENNNSSNLNLSAGNYYATIRINWKWYVCRGISALFLCLGSSQSPSAGVVTEVKLRLEVLEDCKISATDINFGNRPFVTDFDAQEGAVNIACTKGTSYKVSLNQGESFQHGYRQLKFGSELIAYDVYKGKTREVWGDTESSKRSSSDADKLPGVGLGNHAQRFNYAAEILPGQDAKPAGEYQDRIMIKVEF